MKPARAVVIADELERIAQRLETARAEGRKSALATLRGDPAPHIVDAFVERWMEHAVADAVREMRLLASHARPRARRRA